MSTRRPSALGRGDFLKAGPDAPTRNASNPEIRKAVREKLTVLVSPDTFRELKVRAARDKRKLYEIVDEALSRYLGNARAS